jgi:hypothetical protein
LFLGKHIPRYNKDGADSAIFKGDVDGLPDRRGQIAAPLADVEVVLLPFTGSNSGSLGGVVLDNFCPHNALFCGKNKKSAGCGTHQWLIRPPAIALF